MKKLFVVAAATAVLGLTLTTCAMMTTTEVSFGHAPVDGISDDAAREAFRAALRTGDHYHYGTSVIVGRVLIQQRDLLAACRARNHALRYDRFPVAGKEILRLRAELDSCRAATKR